MTGRGTGEAPGAAGGPARHIPVLLTAMVAALAPRDGGRYVDGTFGAGGYARAILDAARCSVLGLDRDPFAIAAGKLLLNHYGDRLSLHQARFSQLADICKQKGMAPVDGVVLDLGVSSMQLDEAKRGFSFMRDGPLDMRMAAEGPSAADVVNSALEGTLADIFYYLGEERKSRAIAREIVRRRSLAPLQRTLELAEIAVSVLGRKRSDAKHPATRMFQALRLYVNDELPELLRGLGAAEQVLRPGGRLVVVTFHSLEDRLVKHFFASRAGVRARPSRHRPEVGGDAATPGFVQPMRRPVEPDRDEITANPRARSARLRWGERLDTPGRPVDETELKVPVLGRESY